LRAKGTGYPSTSSIKNLKDMQVIKSEQRRKQVRFGWEGKDKQDDEQSVEGAPIDRANRN